LPGSFTAGYREVPCDEQQPRCWRGWWGCAATVLGRPVANLLPGL